jgi:hypothetical protein
VGELDDDRVRAFEAGLASLIARLGGAPDPVRIAAAVQNLREALAESATDGRSLSPSEVVRIRASKLVAHAIPAAAYRDPHTLGVLRAEVRTLAARLFDARALW